jgi:radical SAM superfamily enzyme YgiQ (UPF0313 family)
MWMKRGYNQRWMIKGFVRSDIFTHEIGHIMKDMGFHGVRFGAESAVNRVLEILNKGETVEDHIRCIRIARECGLQVGASFMYDVPGETPEEKQATLDFIEKYHIKVQGYYKFMAFPGTPWWAGEDPREVDMRVR